jgi:hypothetical protein
VGGSSQTKVGFIYTVVTFTLDLYVVRTLVLSQCVTHPAE